MTLSLKKFDITTIASDSVCVFIGKRRTGKTYLCKDLLYYNRDIPVCTVISGTEVASPFYSKFMPSMFIHNEYTPELIQTVLDRQKIIKHKMEKAKAKGNDLNIDSRTILILDDCLFDNKWVKDTNIRCIFMNGRHYNLFFLITMQFPLGIPPSLRTNIDYVFILRENNINNRKRIYENYASMFPTFEMFCTVMDQCTENFECLVVQINASSNKLQDQVFWYKAESHEDFKIGAKEFWDAHNAQAQDQSDDEEDKFDISHYQKKNKCKVTVKKNSKHRK
jgi:hypothetical protein